MAASVAGMSCGATANSTNSLHRSLVEYYLSNYLYDTARFYAERLYYEDPSEANLNLWAHVYFRYELTILSYIICDVDFELWCVITGSRSQTREIPADVFDAERSREETKCG